MAAGTGSEFGRPQRARQPQENDHAGEFNQAPILPVHAARTTGVLLGRWIRPQEDGWVTLDVDEAAGR